MLISAKQIILQSSDLYKKNWKTFLTYLALIFVPMLILSISAIILMPARAEGGMQFGVGAIIYFILMITLSVVSTWFSIAFIRVIAKLYYKGLLDVSLKQNLTESSRLIIPTLIASFVVGLIVFGGILLFIIPGIIFAIWYSFTMYEIILTNKKIKESIKGSKSLVKGRWWGVLWRLFAPALVFGLIAMVANFILSIPLGAMSASVTTSQNSYSIQMPVLIFQIISSLVSTLILPLTMAAPTILYLELKKMPVEQAPSLSQA